jgi:ABC-2 type transport system ATP-binding protein
MQYIHRLDVDLETDPEQARLAKDVLSNVPSLVKGLPHRSNGSLTLTVNGRDAIPDLLTLLVQQGIRVYRLVPHEPSLEDVYFALHGEKESIS